MKTFAVILVALALVAGALQQSVAHGQPVEPASNLAAMVQHAGEAPAEEDDDTVNVQLVVFAVVGGIVFLLLPLGYVLRRRLGLTAYTPPADVH